MSKVWYGSLQNRLEENAPYDQEIQVGTLLTLYMYSDRHPYEVTQVRDQKHLMVREMGHRHVGDGCMDNRWELFSAPDNPEIPLVRRGKFWYFARTATREMLESGDVEQILWLAVNGFDKEKLLAKGSLTRYSRVNIRFGHADYHYDYEF